MRTRPPAEASRRDEDGAAGEGVTEGQQSRTSVQPSCCDDGQGVGIEPAPAKAGVRAPHWERNPPVTLRKITLGRRARSHSLLVAGTSRRVTETKRSPAPLRMPRA